MDRPQKSASQVEMPPKLDEESETERVQIVAPASWVQRVEEWRRAQPKIPSRSEAIRALVDQALTERAPQRGRKAERQ